jgi:hypothetical protein
MSRNRRNNDQRAPRLAALVTATLATLALTGTFAPLAVAQTADPGSPPGDRHPPPLTDTQRACLTQHGVQLPAPNAGQPPAAPTDQQRQAFRAAAKACGLQPPPGGHPRWQPLTAAQRTCLTQHGVQPPNPGSVKPPSPPSAQQRGTFEAAAQACGLQPPSKNPPAGT